MLGTYVCLYLTPKGRNETGPNHNLTNWVRPHDRYGAGGFVDATGRYVAPQASASCCHPAEAGTRHPVWPFDPGHKSDGGTPERVG